MEPTEYSLYARFAPGFGKEKVPGALCELFDEQTMKALDLHHAPASDRWWQNQSMELTAGVGVLESGMIEDGDFMPWQISSYAYRTPSRAVLLLSIPIHSEHDCPDMTWNLAKCIARAAAKLGYIDYVALTATGEHSDVQEADISGTDLESEIPAILAPWLFISEVSASEGQFFLDKISKMNNKIITKHKNGFELSLVEKYNSSIDQKVISIFEGYFGESLKIIYHKIS